MNCEEAKSVAQAVIEAFELRQRAAAKRHYGYKSIAKAVKELTGHEPHRDTINTWVRRDGFPMDRDPIGIFVTQWMLERWFESTRRPVVR